MSRRASPSTSRAYRILRVARLWGISRATLYRQRRCEQPGSRRRPGPVGPMPDEALVEAIRELLAASPIHGEGHRKDLGAAAPRWHPHLQAPRAAPDAGARPAGSDPSRSAARPEVPTTARSAQSGSTRCGAPI